MRVNSKSIVAVVATTLLALSNTVSAAPEIKIYSNNTKIVQSWTQGWSSQFLRADLSKSNVTWTFNNSSKTLTIAYNLIGANYDANPNFTTFGQSASGAQFAVGISLFKCPGDFQSFGQFKNSQWGCGSQTLQGNTIAVQTIDVGVIVIGKNGNGTLNVSVTGIAPGTYNIGFYVRQGVGCGTFVFPLNTNCDIALQSGGTFGSYYTVTAK